MRKEEDIIFERTKMQKERVVEKLKERGCRITKQRLLLLDIILSEKCSCCKEIFYEATKYGQGTGRSTVYRMIRLLEEIGAINRKNMYKISCDEKGDKKDACLIELDDNTICHLSSKQWKEVLVAGLQKYGYITKQRIRTIKIDSCECEEN